MEQSNSLMLFCLLGRAGEAWWVSTNRKAADRRDSSSSLAWMTSCVRIMTPNDQLRCISWAVSSAYSKVENRIHASKSSVLRMLFKMFCGRQKKPNSAFCLCVVAASDYFICRRDSSIFPNAESDWKNRTILWPFISPCGRGEPIPLRLF